jgi:hypothetical protein
MVAVRVLAAVRSAYRRIRVRAHTVAARAARSSAVRVVPLRRTLPSDHGGGHGTRDWQHRWVVRMHRVRQWYLSLQQHKVIYCGPCLKGPDDKPMLTGDIVRALVR